MATTSSENSNSIYEISEKSRNKLCSCNIRAEKGVICVKCKRKFHYSCANATDRVKNWKCSDCFSSERDDMNEIKTDYLKTCACEKLKNELRIVRNELKYSKTIISLLTNELQKRESGNKAMCQNNNFEASEIKHDKQHSVHATTSNVIVKEKQSTDASVEKQSIASERQSQSRKPKIFVASDSHGRDCARNLLSLASNKYEIEGKVIPGAPTSVILQKCNDLQMLTNEDYAVIWAGANDVAKNEANLALHSLQKALSTLHNTNVIVVGVPHRHDLPVWSCVNKEIESTNRKLSKIVKGFFNAGFINTPSNKDLYTAHGLHLNATGKEIIATRIHESVETDSEVYKTPIALTWKDTAVYKESVKTDTGTNSSGRTTESLNNVSENSTITQEKTIPKRSVQKLIPVVSNDVSGKKTCLKNTDQVAERRISSGQVQAVKKPAGGIRRSTRRRKALHRDQDFWWDQRLFHRRKLSK